MLLLPLLTAVCMAVSVLQVPVEVRDVNEDKKLELETEKANLERALAGLKGLQ